MSKKSDSPEAKKEPQVGSVAASAGGAPLPPAPNVDPALQKTAPEWEARFIGQAQKEHIAGGESNGDSNALVTSVRALSSIPERHPILAALLAKKGIDAAYFSAVVTLEALLSTASAAVPDDLRRVVFLTPEERKTIAEGQSMVADVRKSLADAGASVGDSSVAHVFVSGGAVRITAASTRAALKQIFLNWDGHRELMLDAGIGEAERARLQGLDRALEVIETTKEARINLRDKVVGAETVAMLATERMLQHYRGRARMACLGNPVVLAEALEFLPRAPDRRANPAPQSKSKSDEAGKKGGDAKGKGGEVKGKSGDAKAAGGETAPVGGETTPAGAESPPTAKK